MGSIFSSPKAPKIRPVITPAINFTNEQTVTEPSAREISRQSREENLLKRTRGSMGTILTGFDGVLSSMRNEQNAIEKPQKKLLGE